MIHGNLQVEEAQFHEYANETISGAKQRGAPLQPLKAAAKEGGGQLKLVPCCKCNLEL